MLLNCIEKVQPDEQVIAPAFPAWSRNRPAPWADLPPVEGMFLGASQLGTCAAAIGYRITGVPRTNPMGEAGFHSVGIGTKVHEAIQQELTERPPDGYTVGIEVPWEIPASPIMTVRSFADVVLWAQDADRDRLPEEVADIKTSAPFGFRKKSTTEGPDRGQILQIATGARALGANRGRLVLISPAELKGRDRIETDGYLDYRENRYTEWVIDCTDPGIVDLVDQELERLAKVADYIDTDRADEIPRAIPGVTPLGARIVEPETGTWQLWVRPSEGAPPVLFDTGTVWQCRYCDWQDHCAAQLNPTETEEEGG